MYPLQNLMGMMPGMPKELKNAEVDERQLGRVEAIIRSMTAAERVDPTIIDGSRRLRIANGSGTQPTDVSQLIKQFREMQKLMKRMPGLTGRPGGAARRARRPRRAAAGSPRPAAGGSRPSSPSRSRPQLTRVGPDLLTCPRPWPDCGARERTIVGRFGASSNDEVDERRHLWPSSSASCGWERRSSRPTVVADSRSPRDGRFIEIVGIYDPRPDPSAIRIDNDKAVGWLRQGAQPTDSVRKLLEISGAWEEFRRRPGRRRSRSPAAKAAPAPAKAASKTSKAKAKAEG